MTNQYFLARIAGRDPNLRASDADRDQVAARLRKSHSEGRLDLSEFQERLESCYAAKTVGQLGELVRDLPRSDPEGQRGARWFRSATWPLPPLAPILIALILLAAVSGHHVVWVWIPLAFVVWRLTAWRRRRWWRDARHGPDDWI